MYGPSSAAVRLSCVTVGASLFVILSVAPALAQSDEPVHGFVVDAQGALATLPQDDAIATPRQTTADNLPSRALGLNIGAHVLPLRWKAITLGFGASLLLARGSKTLDVVATENNPAPPGVRARFFTFAPQVSLNFGRRAGWSYVSAGVGVAQYRAWREDVPEDNGKNVRAYNFGGGARWFTREHLAFSFDLRFNALASAPATASSGGHPAMTRVVISAGISVR
jgi:hypothetical protein